MSVQSQFHHVATKAKCARGLNQAGEDVATVKETGANQNNKLSAKLCHSSGKLLPGGGHTHTTSPQTVTLYFMPYQDASYNLYKAVFWSICTPVSVQQNLQTHSTEVFLKTLIKVWVFWVISLLYIHSVSAW